MDLNKVTPASGTLIRLWGDKTCFLFNIETTLYGNRKQVKLNLRCCVMKWRGDGRVYIGPEREFACIITCVRNKCGFIFPWSFSNILNKRKRESTAQKRSLQTLSLWSLPLYATNPTTKAQTYLFIFVSNASCNSKSILIGRLVFALKVRAECECYELNIFFEFKSHKPVWILFCKIIFVSFK